jgi:hypothetical protein
MLFIFSTPELIRNLRQLKTAVFLHWCLIRGVPFTVQPGFFGDFLPKEDRMALKCEIWVHLQHLAYVFITNTVKFK